MIYDFKKTLGLDKYKKYIYMYKANISCIVIKYIHVLISKII